MLNWWLGKSSEDLRRVDVDQEPPETPAPVFAARALKSAFFGTPAPPNDDTFLELDRQRKDLEPHDMDSGSRNNSPAKPAGILMTPGTAAARRKTVSFHNEVFDQGGKYKGGQSGVPDDCPGKFPSPWTAKSEDRSARKTPLTRTLEKVREGRSDRMTQAQGKSSLRHELYESEINGDAAGSPSSKQQSLALEREESRSGKISRERIPRDDLDGDITLDLNEPHSQSGRYWKSEYDQYHEEAKSEMTKLLKYKHLAKSYAKKKDAEAIDLGERLKEEQRKVAIMEEKISELSAQVVASKSGSDNNSTSLTNELERQKTLVVQYKALVEDLKAEYKAQGGKVDADAERRLTMPDRFTSEMQKELKRVRGEMTKFRDEARTLRLDLSAAERKYLRLSDENAKLAGELQRTKVELENSEKRRRELEGQHPEREGSLQALQKDYDRLKDFAKTTRQNALEITAHQKDQIRRLEKELSDAQDSVQAYKSLIIEKLDVLDNPEKASLMESKGGTELHRVGSQSRFSGSRQLESTLNSGRNTAGDTTGPSKPVTSTNNVSLRRSNSESRLPPRRPSSTAAVDVDSRPRDEDTPRKRASGLPKITPYANRFSNLTMESPLMELPSPEPSLPTHPRRTVNGKANGEISRPISAHIPSSPPKFFSARSQSVDMTNHDTQNDRSLLSRQRSTNSVSGRVGRLSHQKSNSSLGGNERHSLLPTKSLPTEGSRARNTLPPERAAAAKARLEQRMAEKRNQKSKDVDWDKENVRN
ncbi:hypothetical protein BP6252_01636 [Coleophoma cylindrospora]|uniref:Spindle pole body-associated protein cut12 domain-containing protein n=1 Tax=Coleophoma cylindrospora TaxID=1849047 RepID=A0A3D8STM5_9HELO|nr:hypothetical protein BP6252_01636 [Coleophoma cylindrospora]